MVLPYIIKEKKKVSLVQIIYSSGIIFVLTFRKK